MNTLIIFILSLSITCTSCEVYNGVHGNVVNKVRTTAYTEKEKDHLRYKNYTAIGTTLKEKKSIATSWDVFPVGTVLKIDGNEYTVDDYGSALVKPEGEMPVVDVYQSSVYAMNQWGTRYFDDITVVKWGSFEESAQILKDRLNYSHCKTMYNRIQKKL